MNVEANLENAIVYDIGSASTQIGYGGDAYPEISIPSFLAINPNEVKIGYENLYKKDYQISPFFDMQYKSKNPQYLSELIQNAHQQFKLPPNECTALFSQPAHCDPDTIKEWRQNICQIGFETFGYKAISIISDAVLAAFAHCSQTATVIDFGWSCTRVVPVVEGHVLSNGIGIHPVGGYGFADLLLLQLKNKHISLSPPKTYFSQDQLNLYLMQAATELIKNHCNFGTETLDESYIGYINNQRPVDLSQEMKLLSAIHWSSIPGKDEAPDVPPLFTVIADSIKKTPLQHQNALWQCVVSSGGFSSLPLFEDRVQVELKQAFNDTYPLRYQFPMSPMNGGEFCVWTGGSILASSPVFNRYLITLEDYDTHGPNIAQVKSQC